MFLGRIQIAALALALVASQSVPLAMAQDKDTFKTWTLCIWGNDRSFTKPVTYQCLKQTKFRDSPAHYLKDSSQACVDALGADRAKAGFSENSLYASGPSFIGDGKELCPAYCKKLASRRSNLTCNDELAVER